MSNLDSSLRTNFNRWGWCYFSGKDHRREIRYFNKALEVDPDYASTHRGLGNVYYDRGQHDDDEYKYHLGGQDRFVVRVTVTRK